MQTFKSILVTILILGAAFIAAPAVAKTSITKGKQICESAVKAQEPAPKSVRTDNDATRISDASIIYTLRVKKADDSSAKLIGTVGSSDKSRFSVDRRRERREDIAVLIVDHVSRHLGDSTAV